MLPLSRTNVEYLIRIFKLDWPKILLYFRIRRLLLLLLILQLHFILSLAIKKKAPKNITAVEPSTQKSTGALKLLDEIIKTKNTENIILISDCERFNYHRSDLDPLTTTQLQEITNETIMDVRRLKTNIQPFYLMMICNSDEHQVVSVLKKIKYQRIPLPSGWAKTFSLCNCFCFDH